MKLPIRQKAYSKTERLVLRPHTAKDIDGLAELLTNPEITRTFMVLDTDLQGIKKLAEKLIEFSRLEDTGHLEYGVYLDGEIIGFVNDCGAEENTIEIGYVIHPRCQGRGYATEAVRAVLAELQEMGFKKVKAGYFAENTASLRVMEKCGMRQIDKTDVVEYRGLRHNCKYCEICF